MALMLSLATFGSLYHAFCFGPWDYFYHWQFLFSSHRRPLWEKRRWEDLLLKQFTIIMYGMQAIISLSLIGKEWGTQGTQVRR